MCFGKTGVIIGKPVVFEPFSVMAVLETDYNFHMSLLSIIGLWPYDYSKFLFIKKTIISLTFVTFIIPQCLVFTTSDLTLYLVLKTMSPITMCLGALLKYTVFWYQTDVMKGFLDEVNLDWKINQGEGLEILRKHTSLGKFYGKLFASCIYPSAVALVILDITNYITYTIAPRNETYTHNFPIAMEYLVDKRKYYASIVVHRCISVLIGATMFVATETILFMLLQHCASLFVATSRSYAKAIVQKPLSNGNEKPLATNYNKANLKNAIMLHRRALKFSKDLRARNTGSYSILIILGVISLSANLYRVTNMFLLQLSQSLFDFTKLEESLTSLLFITSELAYMFFLNYIVQQLTDSIDNVVPSLYNSNWYESPIAVQKALIVVMLRCTEDYSFTFFGMYCASIEGFSLLLQKSVSGLMLMTSVQ